MKVDLLTSTISQGFVFSYECNFCNFSKGNWPVECNPVSLRLLLKPHYYTKQPEMCLAAQTHEVPLFHGFSVSKKSDHFWNDKLFVWISSL